MKKYFIFAAIAAAGLFASCSSSDEVASENAGNPNGKPSDLVEIALNVSSSPSAVANTRGTGMVGSSETATNHWNKQIINVFMFEKGTLNLAKGWDEDAQSSDVAIFDNAELETPTGVTYGQAVEYAESNFEGTGNHTYIKHKYYPATGKFDFWGYHIDGAGTDLPTTAATQVTVPFKIDGTQDLMVAKAELLDGTTAAALDQTAIVDGWDQDRQDYYYSAFAARRGVDPYLTFNHLLTSLTFTVQGMSREACGYVEGGGGVWSFPTTGSYTGVFVKSISVKSKKTGQMVVAYTAAPQSIISWTDAVRSDIDLRNENIAEAATAAANYTAEEAAKFNASLAGAIKANTALSAAQAAAVNDVVGADTYEEGGVITAAHANQYNATLDNAVNTTMERTPAIAIGDLDALYSAAITADWEAALNLEAAAATNYVTGDPYTAKKGIFRPTIEDGTVNTTPVYEKAKVGAAMLVEPIGDEEYDLTIVLGQYLLDLEHDDNVDDQATQNRYYVNWSTIDTTIKAPDAAPAEGEFKPGYTYNVNIQVQSAAEIKVFTELTKWVDGGNIDVPAE